MEKAFAALMGKLCKHVMLTVPCCQDNFQNQTDGDWVQFRIMVRGDEVLPVMFYTDN